MNHEKLKSNYKYKYKYKYIALPLYIIINFFSHNGKNKVYLTFKKVTYNMGTLYTVIVCYLF